MQNFCCCLRISVVTGHDAWSFDRKFSGLALFYRLALFIDTLSFPSISGFTDRTDFIDIIHAKMYTSRPDGFAQTIVRVVLVMREVFFPVFDQAWWYRLCTDMHQSPLVQIIICNIQFLIVQCKQKILRPRNQQPYNSTVFFRYCL